MQVVRGWWAGCLQGSTIGGAERIGQTFLMGLFKVQDRWSKPLAFYSGQEMSDPLGLVLCSGGLPGAVHWLACVVVQPLPQVRPHTPQPFDHDT